MKNSTWILLLGWVLWSCGEQRIAEEKVNEEFAAKPFPTFNADSAYAFIQQQVDFGPRVPNTAAHQETGEWLVQKLEGYGFSVTEQEFTATAYDGKELELTNIIGSFRPEASKRILLAAHWDTRRIADKDTERIDQPIDGANDGGSGVGVLLEIARVLHTDSLQPNVGIDIVFFDGEDDGEPEHQNFRDGSQVWWCLGSQHWSQNPHSRGYTAYFGILLDMVGERTPDFIKRGIPCNMPRTW